MAPSTLFPTVGTIPFEVLSDDASAIAAIAEAFGSLHRARGELALRERKLVIAARSLGVSDRKIARMLFVDVSTFVRHHGKRGRRSRFLISSANSNHHPI